MRCNARVIFNNLCALILYNDLRNVDKIWDTYHDSPHLVRTGRHNLSFSWPPCEVEVRGNMGVFPRTGRYYNICFSVTACPSIFHKRSVLFSGNFLGLAQIWYLYRVKIWRIICFNLYRLEILNIKSRIQTTLT